MVKSVLEKYGVWLLLGTMFVAGVLLYVQNRLEYTDRMNEQSQAEQQEIITGEPVEADLPPLILPMQIADAEFTVEVVQTREQRARGLSGRESIGEADGMFFVFDRSGSHGIWMKDMNFSIDVIWLNKENVVVDITENLTPESFPKVFQPTTPALYAIETEPGFAAQQGIIVGSIAVLPQIPE